MTNTIFSEKQEECLRLLEGDNEVTEVFYGGAAGGGKSWLGCHWQIARRIEYPGTRGCIGRSQLKNLKRTTLKTFNDVWSEYYKNNPYKITCSLNNQESIIHFNNGSEIILQDLFHYPSDEDFTALGSLEITDAFVDEAPEITQKAFEILQSRIRYKLIDKTPKILLAGNPQHNWIKYRYVKTIDGKPVELHPYQKYIKATVYDNPNKEFREAYIRQLEKLSPYDRERLLNASWDAIDNQNSAFYGLNPLKHFTESNYEVSPDYFLDISFDFNIDPTTAIIGQYNRQTGTYHVFDVILANTQTMPGLSPLQAVCRQIKGKYLDKGKVIKNRIRVTGDASGKAGSADRQEARSFYYTIVKELSLNPDAQVFVRGANTTHVYSVGNVNYVFTALPDGVFMFHGVQEIITDMSKAFLHERSLDKAKKDNRGLHAMDAFRYLIDFWFSHHGGMFITDDKRVQNYIDGIARRQAA